MNLKRLADILGMLGSSESGEVLNAARLANKMVSAADLTWHDVIENSRGNSFTSSDLDLAVRAAQELLQENTELRARVEELTDQLSRVAATNIPAILAENRNLKVNLEDAKIRENGGYTKKPEFACATEDEINKVKKHLNYLNRFDRDFLDSVIARNGSLTEKMTPIWNRIVTRVGAISR